jgi:hypothetical protein
LCTFSAPPIVVQFRAITLSTSPISKLRAADDERRQAKRKSLPDKLPVEAKVLANLKIERPLWRASGAPSRPTLGRSNICDAARRQA